MFNSVLQWSYYALYWSGYPNSCSTRSQRKAYRESTISCFKGAREVLDTRHFYPQLLFELSCWFRREKGSVYCCGIYILKLLLLYYFKLYALGIGGWTGAIVVWETWGEEKQQWPTYLCLSWQALLEYRTKLGEWISERAAIFQGDPLAHLRQGISPANVALANTSN